MTLTSNNYIANGKRNTTTYGDLNNKVLELIQAKCQNIGNLNNVPAHLKNGASWTVASGTLSHRYSNGGKQDTRNDTVTATATVRDSNLVAVTLGSFVNNEANINTNTVAGQLQSYLVSKGVWQLSNEPVSFKGIVNYFNVVSSFISAKIMVVANSFDSASTQAIFYNLNGSTFPATTYNTTDKWNYTLSECQTNLREIMLSVNNVQNIHYIIAIHLYIPNIMVIDQQQYLY